jgi:integrase
MKGRPITGEEFERMLAAVPKAVVLKRQGEVTDEQRAADEADVADWRHYLRGLWWSGLRLAESLELWWDRPDKLRIDLSGKYPMLRIPAGLEKGHRDRLLPIAPEFAEFLLATPESQRRGRVFRLFSRRVAGSHLTKDRVSRMVCRIGKAAGVKVASRTVRDPGAGEEVEKVTYASAHDLRRSFGERWALRVPTPVLQELMRHENIQTTLKYYVGQNANRTAEVVWAAFSGQNGNSFGNTSKNDGQNVAVENGISGCHSTV